MPALQTSLSTHVTAPVNFQLMKGLLKAARKRLPFFNGTLQGQLEENNGAYSVRWERIENLTAATTALGEQTGNAAFANGRDAVRPTVTRVDAAMAKYGNAIILNEEIDLVQVNARAMRFLDTLGANAGESLNTLLRDDIITGATTVRYGNGVASAATTVTAIGANDIKYAVNYLNRQSAMKMFPEGVGSRNIGSSPIRESYFGICHPDVEEDIRDIAGFVAVEQYAGYTSTLPGEFGTVGGVRFSSTEIANITADEGTTSAAGFRGTSDILNDTYDTIIYGMEAIGTVGLGENHAKEIYEMGDRVPAVSLIKHDPGSSGVGDMYNEVGSLAWKAFYAGQVLNANWIVNVKTLASEL